MPGIQRISSALRNLTRLNAEDARRMHVVNDSQIDLPEPLKRYNVRTKDGQIQKYTIGNEFVIIEHLRKIKNKYIEEFRDFISDRVTYE